MEVTVRSSSNSADSLIREFKKDSTEQIRFMDRPKKVTKNNILEMIEYMKNEGYTERRIKNHFKKFDIEIDFDEKGNPPKLDKWQKTLKEM